MSEPRKKKRLQITGNQRFRVLARDGFKCAYCGIPSTCTVLEVDHITPIAEGGTSSDLNLCACCADCNAGKGSKVIPLDRLTDGLMARQLAHDAEQNNLRAAFVAGRLFDAPVPHVDEWLKSIAGALWSDIHVDVLVRMADEVRGMNLRSNKQRLDAMNDLAKMWHDPDMQCLRGGASDDIPV